MTPISLQANKILFFVPFEERWEKIWNVRKMRKDGLKIYFYIFAGLIKC